MQCFVSIAHRSSENTLWKMILGKCPTSSTYTGNRQTLLVQRKAVFLCQDFIFVWFCFMGFLFWASGIPKDDCTDKDLIQAAL